MFRIFYFILAYIESNSVFKFSKYSNQSDGTGLPLPILVYSLLYIPGAE